MTSVYDLPFNSEVLVRCESDNWTGPYCLLAIEDGMCCVQLLSGLISFRSTSVKPYFRPKDNHDVKLDEPEAPVELDELESPLPTSEVPQEL